MIDDALMKAYSFAVILILLTVCLWGHIEFSGNNYHLRWRQRRRNPTFLRLPLEVSISSE